MFQSKSPFPTFPPLPLCVGIFFSIITHLIYITTFQKHLAWRSIKCDNELAKSVVVLWTWGGNSIPFLYRGKRLQWVSLWDKSVEKYKNQKWRVLHQSPHSIRRRNNLKELLKNYLHIDYNANCIEWVRGG